MAAPFNPPIAGQDFQFRITLENYSSPGNFKIAPTLASGDFKVDIDGGGFNNLSTLPSVSPSSGVAVLVALSSAEMNGNVITVTGIDSTTGGSAKEWADFAISIITTSG